VELHFLYPHRHSDPEPPAEVVGISVLVVGLAAAAAREVPHMPEPVVAGILVEIRMATLAVAAEEPHML
jgi:hypothetical protein